MSKFEQLLDLIVNEEKAKADELFHEIVVEMSRSIYEKILSEEEQEEEQGSEDEESEDDTNESYVDEFAKGDEFGDEFPVQDKTDDFEDDVVDHEFGDEHDDELGHEEDEDAPATKDDIHDLTDSLEELKAAFQKILDSGSLDLDSEEDDSDMDSMGNFDDEESDDEESDDEEESADDEESDDEESEDEESKMPFESRKSQGETMREYIEKITATMDGGLVGGRTGETMSAPKEGKSVVSSGSGKPTSGANAKNIAQSGDCTDEDGTSPKGKVGGLVKKGGDYPHAGNFENSQNKGRTTKNIWDQAKKPGNKEGTGVGAVAGGDKAGQTGGVITKSPITGAPNRAK
jgi:hypothetical protein